MRSFPLPAEVESEDVDASYKDGVLTLNLKKTTAKSKAKKIPIKAG